MQQTPFFSLSQFGNQKNNKNKFCIKCSIQFSSALQLQNHLTKFCSGSGFDTLPGLNLRLKNPNQFQKKKYNQNNLNDSLTNALSQIQKNKYFVPHQKQFTNDYQNYKKHQQNLKYIKPYYYQNQNNKKSTVRSNKSHSLYVSGAESNKSIYNNIDNNKDENAFQQSGRSHIYSISSSHAKKYHQNINQANSFISPPSQQQPLFQPKKQFSLLERSDMSIKNMPEDQKRQYVINKLLELQNIQAIYKKNGGKSAQFINNTKNMINFYKKLLEDVNQNKKSKFGKIQTKNITRVSTPISKLQKLTQSNFNQLNQSNATNYHQRNSIAENKGSKAYYQYRKDQTNNNRRRMQTQNPHSNEDYNLNYVPQSIKKDNQIIVIPINQPAIPTRNNQNQIGYKYLENLIEMKKQQNYKLYNILEQGNHQRKKQYQRQLNNKQKQIKQNQKRLKLLQQKYQKVIQNQHKIQSKVNNNNQINQNFRISSVNKKRLKTFSYQNENQQEQYRQNNLQISNVRKLKIQQNGFHKSQVQQQLSQQQKILLQMQKQQRDELQLFSFLPKQLQQIKLQSIKQMAQKRHQMQKLILQQKYKKLQILQNAKQFQNQRDLLNYQIENEKKKLNIHKLMKKKIKQKAKKQILEYAQSDSQSQLSGEQANPDIKDNQSNSSKLSNFTNKNSKHSINHF